MLISPHRQLSATLSRSNGDTTAIRLTPLAEPVTMRNAKVFRVLVKTAFNQRRKTLRNAVKSLFTAAELKDDIFNKRAEELSVQQFADLTFRMNQ